MPLPSARPAAATYESSRRHTISSGILASGATTMPMIQAETVKAVQQLLQDRGIEQRSNEPWGDYIARGLGVSDAKAEAFLEALHAGCSVQAAERAAGISAGRRAVRLARSVGIAVGRI